MSEPYLSNYLTDMDSIATRSGDPKRWWRLKLPITGSDGG